MAAPASTRKKAQTSRQNLQHATYDQARDSEPGVGGTENAAALLLQQHMPVRSNEGEACALKLPRPMQPCYHARAQARKARRVGVQTKCTLWIFLAQRPHQRQKEDKIEVKTNPPYEPYWGVVRP
jgi:hypothetical protein